jgi:voltage-gated sodium channel
MKKICGAIADNQSFQSFILFLIISAAVMMGLETDPVIADSYGDIFLLFNYAVQAVFIFEIAARFCAAPSAREFFRQGWNRFDFAVVALSLVPAVGSFVLIARMLRLLRVLRVLSVSDRLRRFMDRLMDTGDEILYMTFIAALLGYIYSVAGFYLFVDIDPAHWGSFGRAAVSVFYLALFQDIPGFIEPVLQSAFAGVAYFIAFYITVIGLLISVIAAACQPQQERGAE